MYNCLCGNHHENFQISHFLDHYKYSFFSFVCVCILSGIIGHFLLMKKISSLSDGIGHSFFGISSIYLLFGKSSFIFFFLILYFFLKKNEYGDFKITAISSFFTCIGFLIYIKKPDLKEKIDQFLFFDILKIEKKFFYITLFILIITFFLIYIFYNFLISYFFDENFFNLNFSSKLFKTILILYSCLILVVCTKFTSSLLVSGLTTFPTVLSKKISKNFKNSLLNTIKISIFFSCLTFFLSLFLEINPIYLIIPIMFFSYII
jgi:ABC-type Mn2+/Zn2+ transport system permease subunit